MFILLVFSGAPLSQYLKWADYSIKVFNSKHLVFNIVGNDFDQSLLKYKNSKERFHFSKSVERVFVMYWFHIKKKKIQMDNKVKCC